MADQVKTGRTAQAQNWVEKVQAGLERDTGKSLAEWVAIARTCPETAPRARLKWIKDTHGLLQNRAMFVFSEAFPDARTPGDDAGLREALWSRPGELAVLLAVEAAVLKLPNDEAAPTVAGQRKGYTTFSRKAAFAAIRPAKGAVRLGLAVTPDASPRLEAAGKEGWPERLKSTLVLDGAGAVDAEVERLLRSAWERS